ncbi:MAG: transporter suffix domain-containing protein [Actinomycetota bacterium]
MTKLLPPDRIRALQKVGVFLFVLSFIPWVIIIFLLPLVSLPVAQKAIVGTVLAVFAEACFWLSVIILGKEVVTTYRRYLSPRYLWKKLKQLMSLPLTRLKKLLYSRPFLRNKKHQKP